MSSSIVDTHAHIYLPEFDVDRQDMLERAEKESVSKILMPAIDSSTHENMLRCEQSDPGHLSAMMGLHPCSVRGNYKNELLEARNHFDHREFVAVGETGLDFYWDKTYEKEQYVAFHEQIEWALHYNIPVVIHSRESIDECIRVVGEHQHGKLKGVFHCFSGNEKQAKEIISLGFYLGIGGVVTFKNSGLDKVMEQISPDHVILETDAPYLAPVPYRGKRNEPAYLKFVVEKLATLYKQVDVIAVTMKNAQQLFQLP